MIQGEDIAGTVEFRPRTATDREPEALCAKS